MKSEEFVSSSTRQLLIKLAGRYETQEFISADPCFSVHAVEGAKNKETIGFLASSISYGSRKQFLPIIQRFIESSKGEPYEWIRVGAFRNDIMDSGKCFYRLYTCHDMLGLMEDLRRMLVDYGSIGEYVQGSAHTGIEAVEAFTRYFSATEASKIIPKNTSSACKRICMYLRWMVRDNSPVDIGLWSDIIDKRTLIMPMDTHVLQQSLRLGLLSSKTASMTTALRLTSAMKEIFPDDPLRGDFALFGYGVNS